MDSIAEIISEIKEKLKGLIEKDNEVRKIDFAIYYGACGEGRGSTCIRIILPCDEKFSEEC
ncbi:MAG: hypothetical protein GX892_11500 [Thermoanaerobacteraceae bacterium]|nr:hypothetical protein [Thermoanaerobacteraceae bacterium]